MYFDRAQLTSGEKETIASLDASFAADRTPEGLEAVTEIRRSIAKETREALRSAIPDLEERGRAQRERIMPELDRLKGTSLQPLYDPVMRQDPSEPMVLRGLVDHFPPDAPPIQLIQPPHMGELWRASVSGFSSEPSVFYDVDQDPLRIWGHIGYDSDELLGGSVGVSMTFTLPPERMENTKRTFFAVDPDLRVQGYLSGYTGLYHPIFHADDKWCTCWELIDAIVTLSSGEELARNSMVYLRLGLANDYPAGMENANRNFGWFPGPLRFTANMSDLRQRGVSIILRTALRYDFQLEGESDIWFRSRGGTASESVPAFDNALNFRCTPGAVKSIP
ncbi:hypothetical protein ACFY71_39600 [Streptomyces cinerochromogenes]|uniref:hypothetical protein n=1 Tax=Streptomyces cinerochromogenes TaxID=66422 RepID=UPI0036D00889